MTFWRSIAGTLEVELTAAEPERVLTAICLSGITLSDVHHKKDLECSFVIRRRDFAQLKAFCEKAGLSIIVVRKRGLYYTLAGLRQRIMLSVGIGILFASALFLPTRILFVQVEGNQTIPDNRIIDAAEKSGICFGASRSRVRSEKVKNALLEAVPQLQWAGVNTSGCTAVISVRERTSSSDTQPNGTVSSIVADRDGYILSCVVTQGTAKIQPGQTVQKGQTLISGYIDCGICIQATQAKGEIFAQTRRELDVLSPDTCLKRSACGGSTRRISLLLGKKRIFFWKGSGISDAGCGRMYKQYNFTLPGGFRLPVALCVDTYQHCKTTQGESEVQAADLETFARAYLKARMVAGSIQHEEQSVVCGRAVLRLKGSYVCTEVIGKEKVEQIGEANGKTNGENR